MVISRGIIASASYPRKKGISLMAWLENVWLAHSAHGKLINPLGSMFLQVGIGECLETPEYFCIDPLDLSVALWMRNRCIANLDAEVFIVLMKHPTGESGPVVSDDHVRDP
jgi:hypothetical protein